MGPHAGLLRFTIPADEALPIRYRHNHDLEARTPGL
jgi:hypothetical protein